jgi:hypothetical protein
LKLFEDWAVHFSAVNLSDGSMTPRDVLDTINGRRIYLASLGAFGVEQYSQIIKRQHPHADRRYHPGLAAP